MLKEQLRYIGAKGIAKRGAVKVQWTKRGLLKGKSYLCVYILVQNFNHLRIPEKQWLDLILNPLVSGRPGHLTKIQVIWFPKLSIFCAYFAHTLRILNELCEYFVVNINFLIGSFALLILELLHLQFLTKSGMMDIIGHICNTYCQES